MIPNQLRPLVLFAAVAGLAGCSMFREGEARPYNAPLNGDETRLAGLVDSVTAAAHGEAVAPDAGAIPPSSIPDRSVMFALHLASYRTETSAEAGWRIISSEAPAPLGDLHPRVETVDLGPERGVYLRLKAGPLDSRDEAAARCAVLVEAGHYCQAVDFEGVEIAG